MRNLGRASSMYDHLPPLEAIVKAWTLEGNHPRWHRKMQRQVAEAMPLLHKAIERAVRENRL